VRDFAGGRSAGQRREPVEAGVGQEREKVRALPSMGGSRPFRPLDVRTTEVGTYSFQSLS
jgi:hypothetical protein